MDSHCPTVIAPRTRTLSTISSQVRVSVCACVCRTIITMWMAGKGVYPIVVMSVHAPAQIANLIALLQVPARAIHLTTVAT